jgi:hypothetical protein
MQISLSDPLCEFAYQFPDLAARILHRDRNKRRNFREESVTDLLMAGLTAFEPFGIYVDFPKDESKTGEDMDWEFVDPTAADGRYYLRLHIQAKRAIVGAPQTNRYWWYRELDHEAQKDTGYGSQAQTLLSGARTIRGCVPLYMFYHTKDALQPEDAKGNLPALEGVNVMFAHHLLPILRTSPPKKGNGRWPRADKKAAKWRPHFMPLSTLLCFGTGPFVFRLPSDMARAFLVVPGLASFSPGALADRLEELRSSQTSAGEFVDGASIQAVESIPDETLQAIRLRRDGVRVDVERPRAIFYSGDQGE